MMKRRSVNSFMANAKLDVITNYEQIGAQKDVKVEQHDDKAYTPAECEPKVINEAETERLAELENEYASKSIKEELQVPENYFSYEQNCSTSTECHEQAAADKQITGMDAMYEDCLKNSEEEEGMGTYHCSYEDDPENRTSEKSPTSKKARKSYKQIRPKVLTEWSHDNIMKLIKAVEERPLLWDITSPQYKLPKSPAWKEIADIIVERTAGECKAKWSNLRVTFKTNLSKMKKQKSGLVAGGNIVWKYFNAIKFIEVHENFDTNETSSSMAQLSEDSNSPVIESDQPITSQQKQDKEMPSVPPSSLSSTFHSDVFNEIVAKTICTIAERTKEKDQFDAFGAHVVAELHSLPLSKALTAKRKLARALVDIMDEVQSTQEIEMETAKT